MSFLKRFNYKKLKDEGAEDSEWLLKEMEEQKEVKRLEERQQREEEILREKMDKLREEERQKQLAKNAAERKFF